MEKKQCSDCQDPYTYDHFCKKKGTPDGYSYYCRECASQRAEKYYRNSPGVKERAMERNKKAMLKKRNYVMEYLLSHPCIECGEARPECLDFDHQHDKIMNVSRMISKNLGISTIKKEIAKCEVRCANCHRVRTAKQLGWYAWYPRLDSNQHLEPV